MIPLKDENPTRIIPWVTLALISINVLVYIYQLLLPPHAEMVFVHRFGVIPAALINFLDPFPGDGVSVWVTPITGLFLHGGLMHLGGNMLFLWVFGNNIEDVLGHFRFIIFYILCGLAATLVFTLDQSNSTVPLIGASGAISGVMGAYMLLFPRARVLVLFIIIIYPLFIYVPAVVVLMIWLVLQFLNVHAAGESNVAWTAHIAGFFFGMIAISLWTRKRPPRRPPPPPVRPLVYRAKRTEYQPRRRIIH